mgnify:CR=1 FL=1
MGRVAANGCLWLIVVWKALPHLGAIAPEVYCVSMMKSELLWLPVARPFPVLAMMDTLTPYSLRARRRLSPI